MSDIDELIEGSELDPNFLYSTLRERIVEHVFIGDALRRLWQLGITDVEVLHSEFDAGGYDLVMSYRKVVRHIQLKTTLSSGKAANTKLSLKLAEKPSGCAIWIIVSPDLMIESFLWFGGLPGEPLPDLSAMKTAKHSKGNADGVKTERPNHRVVPRGRFEVLSSLDLVLARLFGHLS
ncbi:hypothetical protein [Methylobacterium oryzisoli]|uniref:hypothetical protein n=1 Tax=Methylobacterium oryzisoli TaxID=3385502 RepID=UPI0038914CBF